MGFGRESSAFRLFAPGLVCLGVFGGSSTTLAQDATPRADLERIGIWLASGEPDQRAAAERELTDRIGLDEIHDLNRYLGGDLLPEVRRPLLVRLHELARTRLREVENSIESFEMARALARELTESLSRVEPPDPEREEELTDRRTARRE